MTLPYTRHEAIGNILSAYKHLYVKIANENTDCAELSYEVYHSLLALDVTYDEIAAAQIEQRRSEREYCQQ